MRKKAASAPESRVAAAEEATTKRGSADWRTVDEYLGRLPEDMRAALQALRQTIRSVAPAASEVISYRVPTFRHHGGLVAFAASARHCALYVMSSAVMKAHAELLARYDTSTGTVRFAPDEPLPAALAKKLVKARMRENEAKARD